MSTSVVNMEEGRGLPMIRMATNDDMNNEWTCRLANG